MKHALCLLLAAATTWGEQLVTDRPDHSILLSIESSPGGAEIYSIPASTNEEPVRIGSTPLITPIALRWDTGWVRKKWDKLNVKSIGDLCRFDYDKKQKRYDLHLEFDVRWPDGETVRVEEPVATFAYYEDLDYDHLKGIPSRKSVVVERPAPSAPSASPARKAATRVVLAGEGQTDRVGVLKIESGVEAAEVIVDGKPAGFTPLKLVVREGEHDVVVQKRGYRMYQTQVSINADAEIVLKARLDPVEP